MQHDSHSWLIIAFIVLCIVFCYLYVRVTNSRIRRRLDPVSRFSTGSETVKLTHGSQKEDDGIEEMEEQPDSEVTADSQQRTTRSKPRSKHALFLCVLSLALVPNSSACPDLVTLSINMSLCSRMNVTEQTICNYYQDQVIDVPLTSICNDTSSQHFGNQFLTRSPGHENSIPVLTEASDMFTLMQMIPIIDLQISMITDKWEANKVHHLLFRMAQITLQKECKADQFIHMSCRYDRMTNELTITALSQDRITGLTSTLISFTSRYNIILPSLIMILVFIFFICNKQRKGRKLSRRTRLPVYQSDDSFPPPHPMIQQNFRSTT